MKKPDLFTPKLKEELVKRYPKLVLASGSPNRTTLLRSLGIIVINRPQDILELSRETEPRFIVRELALNKLKSYMASTLFDEALPSLSADTLVCTDGHLAGKPKDRDDAFRLLSSFSGKEQQILSGFALYSPGQEIINSYDITTVKFKMLTADEINEYLESGEYVGAAGGYKIQMKGFNLMESINGSFSNAIGLPLECLLI